MKLKAKYTFPLFFRLTSQQKTGINLKKKWIIKIEYNSHVKT